MVDGDRDGFTRLIEMALGFYGKVPTRNTAQDLWDILCEYPYRSVEQAFMTHFKTSRFFPTPADIIGNLPKDGSRHPSPNEAWAIAVLSMDENNSLIWTDEIADAAGLATKVYRDGDKIAARMIFLERYQANILNAGVPKWCVSLGYDRSARAAAINDGVRLGIYNSDDAFLETGVEVPGIDYSGIKQKLLSNRH